MARTFSGSGQYIEMADATAPALNNMTLSAWINAASLTTTHYIVQRGNNNVSELNFYFRVESSGAVLFGFTTGPGSYQEAISTAGDITTGTLFHVVARYDGANQEIFKDGSSIKTRAETGTPSTSLTSPAFRIGANMEATAAQLWNGDLSEIAIWSAALTDAEIACLVDKVSPLRVRPASLAGYWPLIGRYSPEIDLRAGNNGTLTGPPTAAAHPPIFRPRRRGWAGAVAAAPAGGQPTMRRFGGFANSPRMMPEGLGVW